MTNGTDDGDTTERYPLRAIEALFNEALERPTGSARMTWLQHAAGGDEGLLSEVMGLLAAHETSVGFLERGALFEEDPGDPNAASPGAHVGGQIGPYKLVEELGEGGFGTVFRAEQEKPVRRQVALKVIKLGMDTRQVIVRFEAERQALALMDHPSIARVLDAGSTETGRPYFVMDLAPGIDLTSFCDQHKLTIRERLGVFLDLCSAVQHAHQRGVIHRDLKPSNVLVAEADGRIVPKVIDFGIAKATGEGLTEATLFTEKGQVIGTPVYMSPEQATGGADIDTRADVYSLGVILYELLTGATPFGAVDLREHAAAGDIVSFVRDFEAAAPSTRLTKTTPEVEASVQSRGGTLGEVRSQVKGDLDHVVLCALANDRDRRYESAAALARDVQRVLESRPVEASPPSAIYYGRKFLRRHRVAAITSGAVLIALATGVLLAVDTLRAKRDQAVVLREVFSLATDTSGRTDDPGEFGSATAAARLERRTGEAFESDDPIIVDALATFADRRERVGDLDSALDALGRALRAAERIHGPASRETAYARVAHGLLLLRTGDRAGAQAALHIALESDRNHGRELSPALNEARLTLAGLHADDGDVDSAITLALEADQAAGAGAGGDRSLRVTALETLLELRARADDNEETERTWRALIDEYEELFPPSSTYLARKHVEFGQWLAAAGEPEAASGELRQALESLGNIDDTPIALEFDALRALNQVHAQEPSLISDTVAREFLDRELDAAARRFDPSSSQFIDALGRCASAFALRGDIGRSTELLIERYRVYVESTEETMSTLLGRAVLAQELAERADLIRLEDGLDSDTYVAGLRAIEIALANRPDNPGYLMVQLVLSMRARDFTKFFGLAEQIRTTSEMEGEHPLLLALESIAWSQALLQIPRARKRLVRAKELSVEPQWATSPGLQDTIRWADRMINSPPSTEGKRGQKGDGLDRQRSPTEKPAARNRGARPFRTNRLK